MTSRFRRSGRLVLGTLLAFASTAALGAGDAEKCESAKLKHAGKYAACRLKAESKAAKIGDPADYSKCDSTYASKWQSIESKAGGVCPSEGDQIPIAAFIAMATGEVAISLAGGPPPQCPAIPLRTGQTQCDQGTGTMGTCPGSPSGQDAELLYGRQRHYTDNSDGTITDHATALTWEKLSDDGSIHDKDATYNWDDAFETKIATLNSDEFAGYDDWRLPNRFELETLVDLGRANPAIDSGFNVACIGGCTVLTCGCTRSANYVTSTTYHGNPANAWYVSFFDGNTFGGSKANLYHVRAVRGGS